MYIQVFIFHEVYKQMEYLSVHLLLFQVISFPFSFVSIVNKFDETEMLGIIVFLVNGKNPKIFMSV